MLSPGLVTGRGFSVLCLTESTRPSPRVLGFLVPRRNPFRAQEGKDIRPERVSPRVREPLCKLIDRERARAQIPGLQPRVATLHVQRPSGLPSVGKEPESASLSPSTPSALARCGGAANRGSGPTVGWLVVGLGDRLLGWLTFGWSHRCARLGRRLGLWEAPRAAAFPAALRFVPRERSETAKRCKARARLRAARRATNLEREMQSLAGLEAELKQRY